MIGATRSLRSLALSLRPSRGLDRWWATATLPILADGAPMVWTWAKGRATTADKAIVDAVTLRCIGRQCCVVALFVDEPDPTRWVLSDPMGSIHRGGWTLTAFGIGTIPPAGWFPGVAP